VLPNFWPSRAKEGSQAQDQDAGESTVPDEDSDVAVEDDETEKD
jgi:hypothetical protein